MSDKERDELAMELFIVDNHKQSREQSVVDWEWFTESPKFGVRVENYKTTADGLIAAGYRKPRTITTAEELDALPQWSAILDGQGDVAQKLNGRWHFPETAAEGASKVIKYGPVTLIHEPAA